MSNKNLREKFVESMLAERFGRSDIVEYLSARPVHRDAWIEIWTKYADHLFPEKGNELGEIIGRFERPMKGRSGVSGEIHSFVSYFLLQSKGVKVYCLYPVYLVEFPISFGKFKKRNMGKEYCVVGRANGNLTSEDVVKALANFCWDVPGSKELLLERLGKLVRKQIQAAEDNFDSACAVSPDGTKITIADRVIVVKEDGTLPVFDADLFSDRKIMRPENMGRIKASRTKNVWEAIEMVRSGQYPAVYAGADEWKFNDDLVIHERFVPQPLPLHSGKMVEDIV